MSGGRVRDSRGAPNRSRARVSFPLSLPVIPAKAGIHRGVGFDARNGLSGDVLGARASCPRSRACALAISYKGLTKVGFEVRLSGEDGNGRGRGVGERSQPSEIRDE